MTSTILLVEDDYLNRRLTHKVLTEHGYAVVESKNATEAIIALKNKTIDLVILDINLGEKQQNGIGLAEDIQRLYNIPFIYLTAYDTADIAKQAVATMPHSYITKPFKNMDLVASVDLAMRQYASADRAKPTITVKDGAYNVLLPTDEIDYIESAGNYVHFYAGYKVYKSRAVIKQILELLPPDAFIQTHRAYVINKSKIEKYNAKAVVINNKEIPISKHYVDEWPL